MAEALGFAASVTAVIQISTSVLGLCKRYVEAAKDAPLAIRSMLIEVAALKTVFETAQFFTSCGGDTSNLHDLSENIEGPVESCYRAIAALEKLLPKVDSENQNPSISKHFKFVKTSQRLTWPFKDEKVQKLLKEIERNKTTISLVLTTDSRYAICSSEIVPLIVAAALYCEVCRLTDAPKSQEIRDISTKASKIQHSIDGNCDPSSFNSNIHSSLNEVLI